MVWHSWGQRGQSRGAEGLGKGENAVFNKLVRCEGRVSGGPRGVVDVNRGH